MAVLLPSTGQREAVWLSCSACAAGKRLNAGLWALPRLELCQGPCVSMSPLTFPQAFQFPVSVPALPVNLRSLALSSLWMSRCGREQWG